MSIFKNHKTSADRSATDRSRHKKKISDALKEGIHNIVSNESIIGQDGKKKIKIPVRGIKEYQFVYGDNQTNKKTGSAPGKNVRKNQKIGNVKKKEGKQGTKASNEKGEEFYEVEITLEELGHYLFEDLNLPDLDKKKFKNIFGEKLKRKGYRKSGIRPRLSKKETLKNKIRRKKILEKNEDFNEEEFLFHNSDLKYKHLKSQPKENSSAVIFFIMDTSGSMTQNKKFIARSFFFLLYHFLRHRYNSIEIVFISHSVDAKEVSEDDFFKKGSAGGTIMSSGLDLCLDIVKSRYHPSSWNIYTFHCSDGDNWPEDNQKAVSASEIMKSMCQLYCYIQTVPETETLQGSFWTEGGMAAVYKPIADSKFKIVNLSSTDDVWPQFKKIFGGNANV